MRKSYLIPCLALLSSASASAEHLLPDGEMDAITAGAVSYLANPSDPGSNALSDVLSRSPAENALRRHGVSSILKQLLTGPTKSAAEQLAEHLASQSSSSSSSTSAPAPEVDSSLTAAQRALQQLVIVL